MNKEKHVYVYEGDVMHFDTVIERNWKAETFAISEAKAKLNLKYRWREENGYSQTFKIELPDEIKMM